MATPAQGHSKTRIDKAGKALRDFIGKRSLTDDELTAAVDSLRIVDAFRSAHAKPLNRVNAGLRHYLRRAGVSAEITPTQRLKRMETVIDKLRREPTMALSRMEDIAGVRVVVPEQDQVYAISEMLTDAKNWEIRRVRDYVAEPKSDGYRAVHVVVRKDSCFVELQMRTLWQDAWAQSVEQDTRRLKAGLKFGQGPSDLREYYRMVSELFEMREQEINPDVGFMEALAKLYSRTRVYFPEADGENELT